MASLATVAGAAPSTVNCACSLAGAMAGAPRSSACAVFGAKRASSAITGVMSGASRSTRMLPCGDGAVTMRPLAEKPAPPRSATDSRSICTPLPSTFNRALASRATNAGDGGAADIGGDRHVVRPLDLGAGEQRLAEAERGVDIELGRVERGIELGRALAGGEHISEAAGDGLAVERGLQALDGDLVAAERDVAAQRQRPQVALRHVAAPFQPGGQHLRIAGFDLGRPGEADAVAADREMAAQLHLREAGRAKLEAIEIPSARRRC